MRVEVSHGRLFFERIALGLVTCVLAIPIAAQSLVGDGSVACGDSYKVVSGDTLSRVAARAYGDPMLYGILFEANREVLGGNPEALDIGMAIEIPCVDAGGEVPPESAAEAAASIEAAVAAEGPLSPDQLDTLFGPVALFPDPVLTSLLVAVTFPLDVVKAGRFVEASGDRPDRERAADAAAQPWDESVRDLAGAFPDLVTRMSDHIDWTEQAGEAVLAQTDAVLASIQRLRATAQENGYLVDNEAQDVQTEGDTIVIAPADPRVVYVPTYDSQVVYTTPITSPPAYYYGYDYYGYDDDWADALVAGGIVLGGAVILDEIFDDDDWDGWDDWGGDADIDWDGGDIKIGRGDVNIDGDVNIGGGDRVSLGDGDRVSIGDGDRPVIGDGDRPVIGDATARDRGEAGRQRSHGRLEPRQPGRRPAEDRVQADFRSGCRKSSGNAAARRDQT